MYDIVLGQRYFNRNNDIVSLKSMIPKQHPDYRHGFRFVDNTGRTYKPTGRWSQDDIHTGFDLVRRIT